MKAEIKHVIETAQRLEIEYALEDGRRVRETYSLPAKCGKCSVCKIEKVGCDCAMGAESCFFCQPQTFIRPLCP